MSNLLSTDGNPSGATADGGSVAHTTEPVRVPGLDHYDPDPEVRTGRSIMTTPYAVVDCSRSEGGIHYTLKVAVYLNADASEDEARQAAVDRWNEAFGGSARLRSERDRLREKAQALMDAVAYQVEEAPDSEAGTKAVAEAMCALARELNPEAFETAPRQAASEVSSTPRVERDSPTEP